MLSLLLRTSLLLSFGACSSPHAHLTEGAGDSTATMLARAYATSDHTATFFGEPALAARLEERLASGDDDVQTERLARSWLRTGRTAEAVALYRELLEQQTDAWSGGAQPTGASSTSTSSGDGPYNPTDRATAKRAPTRPADASSNRSANSTDPDPEAAATRARLDRAYTTALLRLAEERNCLQHHNCDSCVYPIVAAAEHCDPAPARAAATRLRRALDDSPDDATTRWLYNLAHQTLGQHPDHVAPQWRVEVPVDDAVRNLPAFVDVAAERGVAVAEVSGGCIFDDLDGDGWADILTSSMYPRGEAAGQLRLFRNRGGAEGFEDVTERAGLTGIQGGLNLIHADYDNDGDLDVFVLRGAWKQQHGRWPNTLLQNQGDGTFVDATVAAGLLAFQPTQVGAWGDYDGDGFVDLFVGNETGAPAIMPDAISQWFADVFIGLDDAFQPTRAGHLYHNNGDGTFTDVADDAGLDLFGWIKGAAFGDVDDDGDLDLFVSRFAKADLLYRNDGDGDFTDVTAAAGVGDQLLSFATWFWDYDDDGDLDLFVAGYPYPEFEFVDDEPIDIRWSPEHELTELLGGRVDDEGAARSRLYRNDGDGAFTDVARAAGLDAVMSIMGANFDDIDGDGRLDLFFGTGAPDFAYLVPNRMFLQRDGGDDGPRFVDASIPLRASHLQKGHGIAFCDYDQDGDQDAYVVLGGAHLADAFPNALLDNPGFASPTGVPHRQITFVLEGTDCNRAALHARLELEIERPDGTRRILHRVVSSGGSFGASSLAQEIGVGDAVRVVSLRVEWPRPNGSTRRMQVFDGATLELGMRYRVREGDARVERSVTPDGGRGRVTPQGSD